MLDREKLKKRAEKAARRLGLASQDLEVLQSCAHGVYEEVSYDLEPDFRKRRSCRRSTVMEVVVDASRLERAVRGRLGLSSADLGKDSNNPLVVACRSPLVCDLIGPAFPYGEYEAGPYEDELCG